MMPPSVPGRVEWAPSCLLFWLLARITWGNMVIMVEPNHGEQTQLRI